MEVVIKLETIPFCSSGAEVIILFVLEGMKNPIANPYRESMRIIKRIFISGVTNE